MYDNDNSLCIYLYMYTHISSFSNSFPSCWVQDPFLTVLWNISQISLLSYVRKKKRPREEVQLILTASLMPKRARQGVQQKWCPYPAHITSLFLPQGFFVEGKHWFGTGNFFPELGPPSKISGKAFCSQCFLCFARSIQIKGIRWSDIAMLWAQFLSQPLYVQD